MATAVDRFLFGMCFGMGLCVAYGILRLIITLLSGAQPLHMP